MYFMLKIDFNKKIVIVHRKLAQTGQIAILGTNDP
jgi:hypothetical protein